MTLTPARPSDSPGQRPLLPLLPTTRHGSRSHLTCAYRCGNACDRPVPNPTDHPDFHTIAERALARRSLLKAGAGAGALAVTGLATQAPLAAAAVAGRTAGTWQFTPVPPNNADKVRVPAGFRADVLISWGDRVVKGAPAFDVDHQTPESAARQFGYNNDYVGVLPHPTNKRGGVLVTNHEYTDEQLMFPTGRYDSATIKQIAMASHGMSVVEIARGSERGSWEQVRVRKTTLNRRLHVGSTFKLVGPAAGDERLRTAADDTGRDVRGTFNNCAGGLTPWGTVLSGEENFNGYFDASGPLDERYTESYARYGISGSGRGWNEVDDRFDLAVEPHEPFRHGWVVELDPYDPESTPRKHTMLGRLKHEGANCVVAANGKVVVYMGDDERFDYIYRFVSEGTFDASGTRRARRRNMRLLTRGTLSVARFHGDGLEDERYDGTGVWIPLASDTESFVEGFTVADVLINTRLAADEVSPTKMDRPEDIEVNPVNQRVYCALTNNSNRDTPAETDEPNPLFESRTRPSLGAPLVTQGGNRNGYVLEMAPGNDNHAGRDFFWSLMLVCGDPEAPETYFAGYPKERVSPISCPDNVTFDPEGNLWIATDGNVLGSNDGLFRVPVRGPERGHVQQFLTVPFGAEACGPFIHPDGRSVFIAPQHPGETDGATFENPSSTWPRREGFPRPSVVVVHERTGRRRGR